MDWDGTDMSANKQSPVLKVYRDKSPITSGHSDNASPTVMLCDPTTSGHYITADTNFVVTKGGAIWRKNVNFTGLTEVDFITAECYITANTAFSSVVHNVPQFSNGGAASTGEVHFTILGAGITVDWSGTGWFDPAGQTSMTTTGAMGFVTVKLLIENGNPHTSITHSP